MSKHSTLLTNLFLFTALLTSSFSVCAQHRDESQMLRKPGTPAAHARAHSAATKSGQKVLSADSIKASAAARDIDESGENSDNYLQAGIRMLQRGDYVAALKDFGEASRQGNHEAQYRIGLLYRDGTGLDADDTEAAYWFRKAGSNGHAEAQYEIALCFMNGKGVLQDTRVAAEWLWRAAEQGHPMASLLVARMYRDGVGMKKDLRRAAKYMSQAADAGIPEAKEELGAINSQLPPKSSAKSTSSKSTTKKSTAKSTAKKTTPRSSKHKSRR